MRKIKRGRLTISVNILMTTSLITRALTLGFVMLSIYIRAGDEILNEGTVKVVNIYDINGIPYGTAVYCLVFSLIGVFGLDLMTGIIGLYGAIRKNEYMLVINNVLSSLLISVYIIYIVLFAIVYAERSAMGTKLYWYTFAYNSYQLSDIYQYTFFGNFILDMGCRQNIWTCYAVYNEKLAAYVETYFGLIVTCITCQLEILLQYFVMFMFGTALYIFPLMCTCDKCVSIVVVEYIYRKIEIKKKNEKISNKKYWILCSLQHGIFRNCLVFIRDSFKKSKLGFFSVVIKLTSLVMGICLLGLGLTIIGHDFITNYQLRGLFYRLQFYNLYLYDVITGVAASSTVLGIATIAISLIGVLASWKRSQRLLKTSIILSLLFQILRIVTVVIWVVLQEKINDELQVQLYIQQTGYYVNSRKNDVTTEWNTMIQALDCCGVYSTSDTHGIVEKTIFCYDNAIEIVAYPSDIYTDYQKLYTNYYGYGNLRQSTCTSKLHLRIRMMIGWFSAITLLQFTLEVLGIMFVNKEFKNWNAALVEQTKTKRENVNATEEKHIMLRLMVDVKKLLINTWKRSKMASLFLSSATIFLLLNFGLLVVALALRYDSVFGNKYINDYIFDDLVIADRSFSSSIKNFHIVVTTFSLASFSVTICCYIITAGEFKTRIWLLYLAILFMGFLFIANVIQIVIWGIIHSHVSDYLTSAMMSDLQNYRYADLSYQEKKSVGWNTLFIKGQCCGVQSYLQSFQSTSWWWRERSSAQIPIYCCKNETILYPYTSRSNIDCTDTMTNGTFHDIVCDEAIKTRLFQYSISFFVISGFILLSEIICIITTSFNIYYLKKEQRIKPAEDMTNEKKENEITDITVGDDPINSVSVSKDENKKKLADITVIDAPIISEQVNTDGDKKKRSRKKKRRSTMESLPPIKERFKQKSSKKIIVDDINEHNLDQSSRGTTMNEAEHDSRVNQLDSYSLNENLFAESKNEHKINYISYNKLEDEYVYQTEMNMEMSYTKPGDDQRLEPTLEEHQDESSL